MQGEFASSSSSDGKQASRLIWAAVLRKRSLQRGLRDPSDPCCVQVLGDNLLSLIKAYNYRGIPLALVKHITRQVLVRP